MEIERRHEGHLHNVNVKYGYIIFGVSLAFALVLAVSNHVWLNKWLKKGAPNRTSVWARLASPNPPWLHVTLWLVFTLGLSFVNTHELRENYTTLIKRFGRLGFYLVPFDILLALRPSLMATSYLEHMSIHKWILRLILFTVSVHGIGYSGKWIASGDFWTKSFQILNLLGIVVLFCGLALVFISLGPIRRRAYKAFYLWHNITIGSFLVLIFWHARPGVADAVVLSICMVAFQIIQRIRNSYLVSDIVIVDDEGSSLRLLRLPRPGNYHSQWTPGAHVRLGHPLTNIESWLFPSHPFTVVSLPGDTSLDLVMKKSHAFQVETSRCYTVSSPYSSLPDPFFQTAEKVVVLCGGSGISLGIPIFRFLKPNASVHLELHWSVSSKSDSFILSSMKEADDVHVYVTNDLSTLPENAGEDEQADSLFSGGQQFELETLGADPEQPAGNADVLQDKKSNDTKKRIKHHSGRPLFADIFSSLLEGGNILNHWIVVCGPKAMINSVKNWGKDHDVQVFLEFYGF